MPRPEPLPFSWGAYDKLTGTPVAGEYFAVVGKYVVPFVLRGVEGLVKCNWEFKPLHKTEFTPYKIRGKLFTSERDALVELLWQLCDTAADDLDTLLQKIAAA